MRLGAPNSDSGNSWVTHATTVVESQATDGRSGPSGIPVLTLRPMDNAAAITDARTSYVVHL